MTDKTFQAPPLPPNAPNFSPLKDTAQEKNTAEWPITRETISSDDFATRFKLSPNIYQTKIMITILGATLFIGLLLGLMFGGGSTPPPAPTGLQGVVINPDITRPLNRCGTISETESCVVYIVNHSRIERQAEYFFDQAVKLTGRQPYLLKIANKQYATKRIPPGFIAQIQIPSLH